MTRSPMFALAFFSCSIWTQNTVAEEVNWPEPAQIKLVEQRLSSLPWQHIVSDVDWYSPLEIVPGNPHLPLNINLTSNTTYEKADALAASFNSYALLVWQDGALRYEKYWPGFEQTSRYDTASMHKTVVALLLGIALGEDAVKKTNQPIGQYLPELPESIAQIPIRAMLEMASGIRSPEGGMDASSVGLQSFLGNDLPAAISRWPVVAKHMTEFSYANANTQYLAWLIEKLSGQRYAHFLSAELWQKIGANDARVWLDKADGSPRASCCLQANARDWLRIGLLIMQQGRYNNQQVVPEDWINAMLAPSALNPNYGWQIWRGSPHNPARTYGKYVNAVIPAAAPFLAEDTFYLDGSGAQRVYIIPSKQMVIVRIGQPSQQWDDSVLPNLLLK